MQNNARVDLETRQQGYHPAEQLIVRLQALTGAQPADPSTTPEIVYAEAFEALLGGSHAPHEPSVPSIGSPVNKKLRSEAPEASKDAKKRGDESASAWKAGVGYGHGSKGKAGPVWDARRAEALQAARDAEAYEALESLAEETRKGLERPTDDVDHARLVGALRTGCLVPLLVNELSSAGFQDMNARVDYYYALLQCIDAIAHPELVEMLQWHVAGDIKSVAFALKRLRAQASTFLHVLNQAEAQPRAADADQDSKLAT